MRTHKLWGALGLCLMLPFISGARMGCLELALDEDVASPPSAAEQAISVIQAEIDKTGEWAKVFVEGGSYDFDNDGSPDVLVTNSGARRSVKVLERSLVLEETIYDDEGVMLERTSDVNEDGITDTFEQFDYGEEYVVSRKVADFDADGYMDELETMEVSLETGVVNQSKMVYTLNETGGIESYEVYNETAEWSSLNRYAPNSKCGPPTTSGPPDHGESDTITLPASSKFKELSVPRSSAKIMVVVPKSAFQKGSDPDFPKDVGDVRCSEKEALAILERVAFILSLDIRCLDNLREKWAVKIRDRVANASLLFMCDETPPVWGYAPRPLGGGKVVKRKNDSFELIKKGATIPEGAIEVMPIRLNKELFGLGDGGQLEETILHEMIHATVSVGHRSKKAENLLDGRIRRFAEGPGTDEIEACGSFCANGHVRAVPDSTLKETFLCTHTKPKNDTEVLQDSLTAECSRCAEPVRRSWCGIRSIHNISPQNTLATSFSDWPMPLSCGEAIGGPNSAVAKVTCGDEDGNVWACGKGHFHFPISCDERYLLTNGWQKEGYAVDCIGDSSAACRDRYLSCATDCGGGNAAAIEAMVKWCQRTQTPDDWDASNNCMHPDMDVLRLVNWAR